MAIPLMSARSPVPQIFSKPPTNTLQSPLASLIASSRTSPPPPPAPSTVFLRATPPPAMVPSAVNAVRTYQPTTPSQTIPVPSQSSPGSSTAGIFSKLALFSQPPAAPQMILHAVPPTAPVGGLRSPTVTNSAAQFLQRPLGGGASAIAPYNPPAVTPASPPVDSVAFTNGPVSPAAPPAAASTQLPGGSSGGFDPYGGQALPDDAAAALAAPAPALGGISLGKVALYGGGALVALYLLRGMFK